ncbi:hypothetical protein SKAU_G00044080 [Synaphobranchus kaupii]|uniref:Uncharacterized protein n=1 Tax=Synaphobranchus kaupii TaxID=118154 RepID=A0A9Q1G2J4_SYNKA|nr:hypothetical protein SKAU_G00044080 [Synaphobranchus kaupii]
MSEVLICTLDLRRLWGFSQRLTTSRHDVPAVESSRYKDKGRSRGLLRKQLLQNRNKALHQSGPSHQNRPVRGGRSHAKPRRVLRDLALSCPPPRRCLSPLIPPVQAWHVSSHAPAQEPSRNPAAHIAGPLNSRPQIPARDSYLLLYLPVCMQTSEQSVL